MRASLRPKRSFGTGVPMGFPREPPPAALPVDPRFAIWARLLWALCPRAGAVRSITLGATSAARCARQSAERASSSSSFGELQGELPGVRISRPPVLPPAAPPRTAPGALGRDVAVADLLADLSLQRRRSVRKASRARARRPLSEASLDNATLTC